MKALGLIPDHCLPVLDPPADAQETLFLLASTFSPWVWGMWTIQRMGSGAQGGWLNPRMGEARCFEEVGRASVSSEMAWEGTELEGTKGLGLDFTKGRETLAARNGAPIILGHTVPTPA